MGNTNSSSVQLQCFDSNLSANSISMEFWEVHSKSNNFSHSGLGTAIVMLVLFLIGVPSNALVIITIIKEKLCKDATHILLLNVAISDLLVCLLVMPFTIVTGFAGEFMFGSSDTVRCGVCQFSGVVLIALTVFSVYILAVITLDRFSYIKFPLHYHRYINVRTCLVSAIIAWIISIVEAVLPLAGFGEESFAPALSSCVPRLNGDGKHTKNLYYIIFILGIAAIPIGMVIFFNIWLACIVGKQIKLVYQTRKSIITNKEELKAYNRDVRKKVHRQKNRKQLALVRAFGGILLANIIVWTPLVIHTIVSLIVDANQIPLGINTFVYVTFITHSVLHPVIEALVIPDIRSSIKAQLGLSFLERKCRRLSTNRAKFTSDEDGGRCHGCCHICSAALFMHESSTSPENHKNRLETAT